MNLRRTYDLDPSCGQSLWTFRLLFHFCIMWRVTLWAYKEKPSESYRLAPAHVNDSDFAPQVLSYCVPVYVVICTLLFMVFPAHGGVGISRVSAASASGFHAAIVAIEEPAALR